MVTKEQVLEANKKFYDTMAINYENVDGRRSKDLENWLKDNLKDIRQRASDGVLLDIGTGTGFLTRCAKGIFEKRVGTDVSQKILDANKDNFDVGVCCNADKLPFADKSFDVITCFAVLHHLFDYEDMVKEVARVLKPGGIFYSDHDIDLEFYKKFRLPLKLYRKIHDAASKYNKENNKITEEIYRLSEWHENGVNSTYIAELFTMQGLRVELSFHWFGLNGITNMLFGKTKFPQGWAPSVSIRAIK